MKKPNSVEAYLASVPPATRRILKELRATIKKAAPEAEERISYGMPYYGYKGRLAYFRHWKNHVGLYIPPPIIANHRKELAGYQTARATVRFPIDRKLPMRLIRKLIKARMKYNEERIP